MRGGACPSSWWGVAIRERIATQVEAIRHWVIIEGDYTDAPAVEATWFIDPPYQVGGKHYKYDAIDYPFLADWCRNLDGQVMVCENEYATWLPFETFRTIKTNPCKRGGKIRAMKCYGSATAQVQQRRWREC